MAAKNERSRLLRPGWIAVGVTAVVFVAMVVFAQLQQNRGDTELGSQQQASTAEADSEPSGSAGELSFVRRQADDPMALGAVDAPVVLVEWLDVRCPFCALFSRETLPTLIDDYVDKGLVRYEVHTVEYFGGQSGDGAVAVLAAGEQGLAMEYLEAIFDAAPPRGHADLHRAALIEFAEQVGVPDLATFTAALDRADLRDDVAEQTRRAANLGISSVPFFVIGNQAIVGAQSEEVFRQVLDGAIEKAAS